MSGAVPALRFPGFEGEWEDRALAEVASVERGKFSARPRNDPRFFGGSIPFVQTGDVARADRMLTEYSQTLNEDGLGVSKQFPAGTIIITIAANIGDVCIATFPVAFPDSLVGISVKEGLNRDFLFSFLKTRKEELHSYATQNAQANINLQILNPLRVPFPSLPEQTKIAEFLGVVDAKLAALRRKKGGLETFKSGLMQQLFAQTLRFTRDDGTDFPDWEEKKLGDVFEVTRGRVLAMPDVSNEKNNDTPFPVFSSQTKNGGLAGYYHEYLYEDAITWTTDGANAGDTRFRKGKFYCTNVCGVLKNDQGYANTFVAEMINLISANYVSYVGNPKLMNGVMASIKISFPHPDEQRKIADALSALDAKISAVGEQIAQMQTFKQGLLQQMFV